MNDATDDPKLIRELHKEEERQAFQLHQDYLAVLGTAGGRNVVWHMLSMCGMFESPSDDTLAREVGHQDVGRRILDRIMTEDSNSFRQMWDENTERLTRIAKIKEHMKETDDD